MKKNIENNGLINMFCMHKKYYQALSLSESRRKKMCFVTMVKSEIYYRVEAINIYRDFHHFINRKYT